MVIDLKKSGRKLIGFLSAILFYYFIHEGSHALYAFAVGAFRQINFIGLGIQVDIFRELMTNTQLGIFCLVGPLATLIFSYVLVALTRKFLRNQSLLLNAITYYTTLVFLILDPLYMLFIYRFVGGGDMNGIVLLGIPEFVVNIAAGIILIINVFVFFSYILPSYTKNYKARTAVLSKV